MDDYVERAIDLILKDVTATVGGGHEDMVRMSAAHYPQFCDDTETLVALLCEDVQQYFHDTYVEYHVADLPAASEPSDVDRQHG